MASLSGNKIKDTYNLLLKLESSEVSSSEQVVEDGAGNNTALKLSTDTVETTGELKISGTPSTSTSNTTALMLSTSGVVVTRDLSTNPIGTTSITPNLPITATGSTVGLADPAALSEITTPATIDKYLIWDESASEYKYIESQNLATTGVTATSPITGSAGVIGLDDPANLTQLPASGLAVDDKYLVWDETASEYKSIESQNIVPVSAPITKTASGEVTIDDPINLDQITSPATDDKYLIWDESASAYKYIDQDDLKTSMGGGATPLNMIVAKMTSNQAVSSSATAGIGIFAEIVDDSSATGATSVASSSVLFGSLTNGNGSRILYLATSSDPRDSVLINEYAGWYKITAVLRVGAGTSAGVVEFQIKETTASTLIALANPKIELSEFTNVVMEAYWYSDGVSGYKIQLLGNAPGIGFTVFGNYSSMTVEYLGDNATL